MHSYFIFIRVCFDISRDDVPLCVIVIARLWHVKDKQCANMWLLRDIKVILLKLKALLALHWVLFLILMYKQDNVNWQLIV